MLIKFLKNTNGSIAVEYSLLAAMVAILAIAGVIALGDATQILYDNVAEEAIAAIE